MTPARAIASAQAGAWVTVRPLQEQAVVYALTGVLQVRDGITSLNLTSYVSSPSAD